MKRKIVKDEPHQKYFLRDGSEVTGCSTIAKFGENPDGLIAWANREGLAGRDHRQAKDAAADSGVIAHALAEAYLIGDELDLSDFTEEAQDLGRKAFEKFREWWEVGDYTFLYSELQLTSEAHRFGGTLDILCRTPRNKKCLIDLKATKSLRTSHLIQVVGGYLTLENENRPDDPVDEVCILRLPKDGGKIEELWPEQETFPAYQKVFLANLAAYNARHELDKVDPIAKKYKRWKKR